MVSDAQVRLLRQKRMERKTQEAAAAAAGMSVRTARTWARGPLPSAGKTPRSWRTRPDPFAGVWEQDIVPLLTADDAGVLEATTVLDVVAERHGTRYGPSQLRTLQRRVRDWRALHGPGQEVYFEQVHPPGREAAVDFTHASELGVTIAGTLLRHLLFQFVLSASGWRWVAIAFGETFEALVAGLQGALWALGGVPAVLRSDNLSAATHELKRSGGRALTTRFAAVLDHYGMASTRIRPGEAHENGVAEQANHRAKVALAQALVLRGSADFPTLEAYAAFLHAVIDRRCNEPVAAALATERPQLRPLPAAAIPSYTCWQPHVRRWSTIRVGGRTYSVPSRLIGHPVEVRQELQGSRTASGERFDQHALTAASRSFPIGTHVRVTNLANGRSVVVRVNDRGPFVHGRVLDVSHAAATALGMVGRGTARVGIESGGEGSSPTVTGDARVRRSRRRRLR